MDNKNQILKKFLVTTLATNMLLGGVNMLGKENVASAWWWSKKHTQEEIDAIYNDGLQNVQDCLDLSKKLNDSENAQSFIQAALQLKSSAADDEKTYENAIKLKNEAKSLQEKLELELNLQEIELRKKAEEAEQEAIRIENEHRRKLEEQRLQMEKEERERLELIDNAKAALSEKVASIMRKARQNVEFQENVDHIVSVANEIEEKIQLIDNLNRVEGVEALIEELQADIKSILIKEIEERQEFLERKLKETKSELMTKTDELSYLLSNLDNNDENFEELDATVNNFKETINSLEDLSEVDNLQKNLEDFKAQINFLLELQTKKEAERKELEELERELVNERDPKMQLEMLSEGKIALDDVIGGNQKAKAKSLTLIRAFERYNNGGKFVPSKGLLLYGPPGTGKTSFVTAFAAEQGLEAFTITPSLVMGDNGERKVLEIIEQAKKSAQVSGKLVVLLIDEIDAIAQKRSSSSSDKVLVMLMNEIDKLKASDNVVVFATTNRREALDQAIIRSGRLDQSVEVGLPNAEDKEKIINIYLKNLKVDSNFNLKSFIDKMRGFSGADIKRAVEIAINSAMEKQNVENLCDVVLTNVDMQEGIATIMDEKTTIY